MIAYEIEVEYVRRETVKVLVEKDYNSDALSVLGTLMVKARTNQNEGETTRIVGVHPFTKRNGARLTCGCWTYDVHVGQAAGSRHPRDLIDCKEHGPRQIVEKCNVEEPDEAYMERMSRWG